jgi:hypothetical protein
MLKCPLYLWPFRPEIVFQLSNSVNVWPSSLFFVEEGVVIKLRFFSRALWLLNKKALFFYKFYMSYAIKSNNNNAIYIFIFFNIINLNHNFRYFSFYLFCYLVLIENMLR